MRTTIQEGRPLEPSTFDLLLDDLEGILPEEALLPEVEPTFKFRSFVGTPVQRLCLALLKDCCDCLLSTKRRRGVLSDTPSAKMQRERDLAWVRGAPAQISFTACCEILLLDPDAVREGILRLVEARARAASVARPSRARPPLRARSSPRARPPLRARPSPRARPKRGAP